jgi:hypothetical protein
MYLGIDQQSGLVYEGIEGPVLPVVPRPTVTQAKLIKRDEDWNDLPTGIGSTKLNRPSRQRIGCCRIPTKIRLDEASVPEVGPPGPCSPTKLAPRSCSSLNGVWG